MSWKEVWLITTLAAVARTEALSINVTSSVIKKPYIAASEQKLNNILDSYEKDNNKVAETSTDKPLNTSALGYFQEVNIQNNVGPDKNVRVSTYAINNTTTTDPSNHYDMMDKNEYVDVTIPSQVDVNGSNKRSDKINNRSVAFSDEQSTIKTDELERTKFLSEIEDNHETRQYRHDNVAEKDNEVEKEDRITTNDGEVVLNEDNGLKDRDNGEDGENKDGAGNSEDGGNGESEGNGQDGGSGESEGNGQGGGSEESEGNGQDGGNGDSEGNGQDGGSGESEGNGQGGGSQESEGNGQDGGSGESGGDEGNGEETVESAEPTPPMNIVLNTESGPVRGYKWPNFDEIISYMDIPYGKFTLFEAPQKPDSWETVHDVKQHSKRCPQMDNDTFVGRSDCLILSIFTPKDVGKASVLFYIHGSNSKTGSGNPAIYGPEYMLQKGVILVLPNYRLGALGFLCLQNDTVPGNAALKDLSLALEWTINNIEAFGGDPSNIAISGDGTSGALAGYLALSPTSKHYIKRVITESGSLLSHWAIDRNPINTATQLAKHIRKSNEDTEFSDNIFSDIDLELLIRTSDQTFLRPCIEYSNDGIIKNKPWSTLNNEAINISFVIGSTNHAALAEALQYDNQALSQLNENYEYFLPNDLNFNSASLWRDMGEKIRKQYFGTENITSDDVKNLSLYLTDVSYLGPDLRLARALVAAGATVYLYEFSYIGGLNKELHSIDAPHHGAIRGDAAGYLFAQDGRIPNENSEDRKVVDLMTDLWVSFIEKGYPTADGVVWNKFNKSANTWLSIGAETSLEIGFHEDRLTIWTEMYEDHFVDRSTASDMNACDGVFYAAVLCLVKFSLNVIYTL